MTPSRTPRTWLAVAISASLFGCRTPPDLPPGPLTTATPSATAIEAIALPPPPAEDGPESITGTVQETMNAGGYTYVRLATAQGERWGAVPETDVAVGEPFTISGAHLMSGITSRVLRRTFDQIYFGLAGGGYQQIANMHSGPTSTPSLGPAAPDVALMRKVDGPHGRTIAEIIANRAALKGATVAVRGQVVRFTANVLGSNWLHLRDDISEHAPELTVTTAVRAAVGDIVVATGTVRVDRDFGAGNAYPVILEEAMLEK